MAKWSPVTKGTRTLFEQTYIIIVSSARLSLKVRWGKCVVWQTTRRRQQWRPHKRQACVSVANKCRRQALSFVFTALRKELRALMNLQSTLDFVSRTQVSKCQLAVRTPTLRKQIYKTKINFLLNLIKKTFPSHQKLFLYRFLTQLDVPCLILIGWKFYRPNKGIYNPNYLSIRQWQQ